LFYLSYRLVDRSQRYDPSVTAKLESFVKRLKHAIEDKFGGEEPIEVLQFLRTFREAADQKSRERGHRSVPDPLLPEGERQGSISGPTQGRPSVDAEVPVYGPVISW
jgi:hypothetical protein